MNSRSTSLAGLFISSVGYALALQTKPGKRFDREHTWFATVMGVLLTLGWLSTDDDGGA